MENASKAIIMAGGILIALLVVSTLVIGWNRITDYQRVEEESETVEQLANFNKEFESYNKGVVRGYELISLFNLVQDTNERYSEDEGFKKLEVYVKFLKNTTVVTNIGDEKKQKKLTAGYMDLTEFIKDYYNYSIEHGQTDYSKIFKESYFQCDRTEYDGETGEKGSGRIQKLYFTQIERIN